MYVLVVPKPLAEAAKEVMVGAGLLDKSQRIVQTETVVEFPLLRIIDPDEISAIYPDEEGACLAEPIVCKRVDDDRTRTRLADPIENIRRELGSAGFTQDEISAAPGKWELLGDVLIIKVPPELAGKKEEMARAYAKELEAKSVLEEFDKVQGELRVPQMRLLFGEDTETIHKENGVFYELDAARIMFSSGNVDERIRMARLGPLEEEVIVDMFAGIGYFTIPLAVYSKPRMIYACEKNEVSFGYLKRNISVNGAGCRVTPLLGDNRDTAPMGLADRIIMGYVGSTHEFLPRAMDVLRPEGGTIHYHETCPNELLKRRPVERVRDACADAGRCLVSFELRKIKSYAPGITHVVVDARID